MKTAYQEQLILCKEKGYPVFAPEDRCWSCKKDIWSVITPYEAGWKLITSCPHCNRSFTD